MHTRKAIIEKLSEIKPELQHKFGVSKIGLFGSFSTGKNSPESDIDLLVEFNKSVGWDFFTLQIYLENIFKRKVDLVTKRGVKEQLKTEILNQVEYLNFD